MKKLLFLLSVILISLSCGSKKSSEANENQFNIERDTSEISIERLNKLDHTLKEICETCLNEYDRENDFKILNNKEKARSFGANIALTNYPDLLKPIRIKCSEDKTGKFWFIIIHVCPSENCFGGELELIVYKNNGKIVWYNHTV